MSSNCLQNFSIQDLIQRSQKCICMPFKLGSTRPLHIFMNSCTLQVHSSVPHFSLMLRRHPLISFVLISHLPCLNNPRSESMGQFLYVLQPLMMVRRAGLELRSLLVWWSAALSVLFFPSAPLALGGREHGCPAMPTLLLIGHAIFSTSNPHFLDERHLL